MAGRADAATDLAAANTDLVAAQADLDAGDSLFKMIGDLRERLAYIITRCRARTA